MKMNPDLLTTTEAARLIGVSGFTVRRLCDRGVIPCWRLPTRHRDRRISLAALQAWAAEHGVPLAVGETTTPQGAGA